MADPAAPRTVQCYHCREWFDVPARAGEASTMTGGAPNMVTDNSRVIMQSDHPVVVVN